MAEFRIGTLGDFPDGEARRVDTHGHRLAVVRIGDTISVIADRCSHAEASLSEGEVDPEACTIECPKHGALFSVQTGEPLSLPATRPVQTYVVRVDGDVVVVEVP